MKWKNIGTYNHKVERNQYQTLSEMVRIVLNAERTGRIEAYLYPICLRIRCDVVDEERRS